MHQKKDLCKISEPLNIILYLTSTQCHQRQHLPRLVEFISEAIAQTLIKMVETHQILSLPSISSSPDIFQ